MLRKSKWMAMLIVLAVSLTAAGCVTTRGARNIEAQKLKSRISYLEAETSRKDREIQQLKGTAAAFEKALENTKYLQYSEKMEKESKNSNSLQLSALEIQKALKRAGFYNGPVDGKIGTQTRDAIKAFQKAKGLKIDGVVGRSTWAVLNKHLN